MVICTLEFITFNLISSRVYVCVCVFHVIFLIFLTVSFTFIFSIINITFEIAYHIWVFSFQ